MKAMHGNRRLLALLLSAAVATAAMAQEQERKAKSAVDDRADPKARLADVGKGTHMARQPLKPGAYFNDKAREAVHAYYAAQKGKLTAAPRVWKIGESLPTGAAQGAVPPALLARLPRLPPGHRYVQVGSDVVLIAAGSKMVVDGIDAVPR